MAPFAKRIYTIEKFGRDIGKIVQSAREVPSILTGKGLDPMFRERIMLAVTAANDCRYCAFAHTRFGLLAGLSKIEIDMLLTGSTDVGPSEGHAALKYARSWAERDGIDDPEQMESLAKEYGAEKAAKIETVLTLIRIGNLSGNTFDSLLHRLQ